MASLVSNCPTAISAKVPGNAKCLVTGVLLPISGPQSDLSNWVLGYSWKEDSCPQPGNRSQCQAQTKLIKRGAGTPAEGQV